MKKARKQLTAYIRDVADRMGLKDYELEVSCRPKDEPGKSESTSSDRNAAVRSTIGRKKAYLWFNIKLWNQGSLFDRRQTVVHELMHVMFALPRDMIFHMVETDLELAMYDSAMEYPIDRAADLIALAMPFPDNFYLS
jgi:hypothetical protein